MSMKESELYLYHIHLVGDLTTCLGYICVGDRIYCVKDAKAITHQQNV